MSECYDFPEIVLHDSKEPCGRYKENGVCVPLAVPDPPETERQRQAVESYKDIMRAMHGMPHHMEFAGLIRARGITVEPE